MTHEKYTPEPAIEVKNLSKCYTISHKQQASYSTLKDDLTNLLHSPFRKSDDSTEKFWALKNISFEVPKGEVFGVIGQNGSGKSTLLKILSRIVEPTEGSIELRGRVSSLLEVGTGFHPELTGRENIFFNGSMLGMSTKEIRKKFDEIVEFSEVEKFIDTPVKYYSSGMYVRLAFAVAAHLDPDILILDEVLAVGDAAFQKKSLKKIQSTLQDGKTVLFVSHAMSSVRQLCTNGIMLDHGKIVAQGKVDDIIEAYTLESDNKIATQNKSDAEPTWKNGGSYTDDTFQPEEVFITDKNGNVVTDILSNGKAYELHVIGNLRTEDPLFNLGYAIWDETGRDMMYMTFTTDKRKADWPTLKKGVRHVVANLPANMLNVGPYRLKVISSIYGKRWIQDPDSSPVKISLQVRHADQQSPLWKENRGGLFTPIIDWEVIQ